jgi:acylphosphatase
MIVPKQTSDNDNKIKARILVKGNVRNNIYKTLIKLTARNKGIRGELRDFDDSIEIFCESDKETLTDFIKQLRKGIKEYPLCIDVTDVEVYYRGESNYIDPNIEYGPFEVKFSVDITPIERKMLEADATVALLLIENIKDMQFLQEQTVQTYETLKELKNEAKKIHGELKNVYEVDREISGEMRRLSGNIKDTKKRGVDPGIM